GGEVIGHIGRTGSGITGAHLHWGVALARPADLYKVTLMNAASRNYLVDPAQFVAARMAGTAGGGVDPFDPEEDDMFPAPFLLYNPSSQHETRRGWWQPGSPIDVLTTEQAVVGAALKKQILRLSST